MAKSIIHEIDGISRSFVIRPSTDEDIHKIHEWLLEEERLGVHGNFLDNWNLTEECHQEGTLLVLVDELENLPVAYQWGQLLHSGILQVRDKWRGKGLGLVVVQHCVELALEKDEMVLQIECKPSSSIPFWRAMRFTIVDGEYSDNSKGYRILSKELMMPQGGKHVLVQISLFPEERKWQEDVPAAYSHTPKAITIDGRKIYLSERISFPNSFPCMGCDPVIEIMVGNQVVYRDKAKYQEAQDHGVKLCRNGFYIDVVTT